MTNVAHEWRNGWRVLAASGVALGCGANLHYYLSTFFVKGITNEFGITRGELASIQALALWGVVAAPVVGHLIDRSGANRVLTVGSLLLGLVYIAAAHMPPTLWAPLIIFLAIQSLGQATATVPHTRVVSSWFARYRGTALGIAITGIPLMSAAASPVLAETIATWGWRAGYYILALLALFVALPLNWRFVRERTRSHKPRESSEEAEEGDDLRTASRSRAFWLLVAAMILINIPGGGFLNQLVPMLLDDGFAPVTAALMVSVFSIAVIAGRLASGILLDRLSPAFAAAGFTFAPAAGMLLLLLTPVDDPWVMGVGVALIGVQQGAEIDLLAFFTARYFGLRRYSSIYAVGYAVATIATSFGVLAFGLSHDWTGSYAVALGLSSVAFTVAAGCFLALNSSPPFRSVRPVTICEPIQAIGGRSTGGAGREL